MNRLILVGNGFDLAHDLKTSYKDFIFWYLDDCFGKAGMYANGHFHEDDLIYVQVTRHYSLMALANISKGKGICAYLYEKGILHRYLDFELNEEAERSTKQQTSLYYEVINIVAHEINVKSCFLKRLVDCCIEKSWVDVETEYFEQLKKCKNKDSSFDFLKVDKLNRELSFLKNKLEEYLTIQAQKSDYTLNPNLIGVLKSNFKVSDFDTAFKGVSEFAFKQKLGLNNIKIDSEPKLYLLNFNYTNTLVHYLDHLTDDSIYKSVEVNHIHGELHNPKNPIIFGFGDEHDKDYLTFEEQGNNDLFTHIKNYQYFKTSNYRDLVRFLNNDEYQVFVMGHSGGISDRTMFKEIFDHEHCKSVKIFHYESSPGVNDFWEKTVNLGRHFSDKGRMRKLIVEFNEANAFPQFN